MVAHPDERCNGLAPKLGWSILGLVPSILSGQMPPFIGLLGLVIISPFIVQFNGPMTTPSGPFKLKINYEIVEPIGP